MVLMGGPMDEQENAGAALTEDAEPAPDVARFRAELDAAARRADDLMDQLKRARADYENLSKRTAKEIEEVVFAANTGLLAALLPALDDFDHALEALPAGDDATGVRLLHANLWRVLLEEGLEAVDPAGMPFDPFEHEVVGRETDEALSDGVVKAVVQKGYRYRRRLLRPAKVVVVKRGA